ncbi:uncharacterized protein ARMOST_12224 [Armillaria ostoyae]|uniref:Uncharacterized protein n=1 Tax=Armillaria ostoyae TaxID=47428 RepID=A0A284RJD0_ARMOS|nr:uncharacterized protein ARMOST_12224 [Armillaria ostoyae]
MDYEMNIAAEMERPIPASDVSLLDITRNKHGVYWIEAVGKDTFNIVGRLERGMSPMAHILISDIKEHGWFMLTCASKDDMDSVLFNNQVRLLRDIIRREENKRKAAPISWLTRENSKGIVVYVDYDKVELRAPWGDEPDGVIPYASNGGQDLTLQMAAHHQVHVSAKLQKLSKVCMDHDMYIIKATDIHIVPH